VIYKGFHEKVTGPVWAIRMAKGEYRGILMGLKLKKICEGSWRGRAGPTRRGHPRPEGCRDGGTPEGVVLVRGDRPRGGVPYSMAHDRLMV